MILRDLEKQLQEKAPPCNNRSQEHLFELPALIIDGIPTTLEKMNQVLRDFLTPCQYCTSHVHCSAADDFSQ